ncbi:MAG: NAD+ synthase [Chlamydiales bacterium]|nr:NAD+ synthase [Chlamydiales bacterium]
MRVIAAQLNPTVGDLEENTKKILQTIERARAQKADLLIFPEMSICGYPPEDLLLHSAFIDQVQECLEKIIKASSKLMLIVGLVRWAPKDAEKPLYNSAAIIEDGKLLGYEDKCLLPTYDVFDERRYFQPGSSLQTWTCKGKKIAVMICEDIWQHSGFVDLTRYSKDPVLDILPSKPDLLVNISASPYQYQKPDVRIQVCAKSAKTLQCPVILCCQVGGNDQLIFDGYSICVDRDGKLRQIAAGFKEEEMLIDFDALPPAFTFSYDAMGDLYEALVLGTRDYFHKSGFKKGCLGLSGGIDSALVACIAADALGKENVLAITMPSRFSSTGSVTDSQELARRLDIELIEVPIEGPFEAYLELLEPLFKEMGKPDFDVTEENLQARVRGTILMSLSNKFGHIVLSTANKSEMSMGYSTLYGDMCGGLAVISDVSKTQIYALCKWLNRKQEIIPQAIIDKPPSAELRPDQKDSDTLPDYATVDAVLQGYVEEFLSPEEISKRWKIPLELVIDLIHRIHRAEYKRRQAAPGIRVSKKAFRVGRAYPIVQRWM